MTPPSGSAPKGHGRSGLGGLVAISVSAVGFGSISVARFLNERSDDPNAVLDAVLLVALVLVGVPSVLFVLAYVPHQMQSRRAQRIREARPHDVVVSGYVYPNMRRPLASLTMSGTTSNYEEREFFTLVGGTTSLEMWSHRGGSHVFINLSWDHVAAIVPTVIAGSMRSFNGLSIYYGPVDALTRVDIACAREGAVGVFKMRTQSELAMICEQLNFRKTGSTARR